MTKQDFTGKSGFCNASLKAYICHLGHLSCGILTSEDTIAPLPKV